MEEEQSRKVAWRILGEVEEVMSEEGVGILSEGRYTGRQEAACFLDPEYAQLEKAIAGLLRAAIPEDDEEAGTFITRKSLGSVVTRR